MKIRYNMLKPANNDLLITSWEHAENTPLNKLTMLKA